MDGSQGKKSETKTFDLNEVVSHKKILNKRSSEKSVVFKNYWHFETTCHVNSSTISETPFSFLKSTIV